MTEVPIPAVQSKSFVLRGQFSPEAFHPSWFLKHDLLRTGEVDRASVKIVSPAITQFDADWLKFQVTQDRLIASTLDPVFYEPLRDLVVGVIEVVAHASPIRLLGMNHHFHFGVDTEEQWHHIGHVLAPKKHWSPLSSGLGLKTLVIEGTREDDLSGYVYGKVEPSTRFDKAKGEYGVYIDLNDHVEVIEAEVAPVPESAQRAAKIISEYWDASVSRAQAVATRIMMLASQEEPT
jgi:hypothetical protein